MTDWPDHLPGEGLHLWFCQDLHSPRVDEVMDLLAPEEQERARAYRYENDRRRYLGSVLLQRSVLARYFSCSAGDLSFSRNEWGKPFLEGGNEEIGFNVSRSHEVALLAVSGGRSIGVDVEYEVSEATGAMGVASQFSEPERGYIAEAVDSRRALFEIWARKEAYIKGMGRGLSHPLGDFDVTPIGEMLVRDWSADSPPESWAVQSVKLPVSGYAAAIGMVYPLPPIEVIEVTVDVLLSYFFQSTR